LTNSVGLKTPVSLGGCVGKERGVSSNIKDGKRRVPFLKREQEASENEMCLR